MTGKKLGQIAVCETERKSKPKRLKSVPLSLFHYVLATRGRGVDAIGTGCSDEERERARESRCAGPARPAFVAETNERTA